MVSTQGRDDQVQLHAHSTAGTFPVANAGGSGTGVGGLATCEYHTFGFSAMSIHVLVGFVATFKTEPSF